MSDKETILQAFFALAGSRSPALTKRQQDKELARCWKLLSEAVYSEDENKLNSNSSCKIAASIV